MVRAAIAAALLSACHLSAGAERRADLEGALARCAAIADRDQRLACYDALAAPQTAPAVAAAPTPLTAPAVASAPSPAPVSAATAPAAAAENFGQPPPRKEEVASITAAIVSFGQTSTGHLTAKLDNGQLWELEDSDPLLAVGDSVTIRRGALGSFLLTTSAKRTHRVRRIH
jgi:hypothetical protein